MNKVWKKIRPYIRGIYRVLNGLKGFIYDFKRFVLYGGWKEDLTDIETRNYNAVIVYHGLEKSLSYKKRNPKSGWKNAEKVLVRLKIAIATGELGYHDKAAKQVLLKFLNLPENINLDRSKEMKSVLNSMNFESPDEHGVKKYSSYDFNKGKLNNPEDFFFSRHSLREFKNEIIEDDVIQRAFNLAMKTPSVCNRQPWHIYHSSDSDTIKKVLKHQNGNRPFGEEIQNLILVTIDLKAFFSGNEHYQHWIDGGLVSMSLMYAFHSLGIASCALNWSANPKNDKCLRKLVNIKPNQTVILMLAIGYPDKENIVCSSTRRPKEEVFSKLKLK